MALRNFKPYTPTRRFLTSADFTEITASRPEKGLLATVSSTSDVIKLELRALSLLSSTIRTVRLVSRLLCTLTERSVTFSLLKD
jgi:hypothetical protein